MIYSTKEVKAMSDADLEKARQSLDYAIRHYGSELAGDAGKALSNVEAEQQRRAA